MTNILFPNRSKSVPVPDAPEEIELNGMTYPIRLRRMARARSISLYADPVRGEVRINLPSHVSQSKAISFAHGKKDWLAESFVKFAPPHPLIAGGCVAVEGREHVIIWDPALPRRVERNADKITLGGPQQSIQARLLRWLRKEAARIFADDIAEYCEKAREKQPKVTVGDARRRWGSCSSSGNIRLSWRLVMMPENVRRAVIAHEVAHMRHMNHSTDFYDWLDTIYEGDRAHADDWLRMHGPALHMVGRGEPKL